MCIFWWETSNQTLNFFRSVCNTNGGQKLKSWQKETKQHKLIQFHILGQFWKKLSNLCAVFYFQLQALRIYSNVWWSFIITTATTRFLSQLQCQTDKKQAWNNCIPSNKPSHYPTPVFLWLETLNSMLHPWTGFSLSEGKERHQLLNVTEPTVGQKRQRQIGSMQV